MTIMEIITAAGLFIFFSGVIYRGLAPIADASEHAVIKNAAVVITCLISILIVWIVTNAPIIEKAGF